MGDTASMSEEILLLLLYSATKCLARESHSFSFSFPLGYSPPACLVDCDRIQGSAEQRACLFYPKRACFLVDDRLDHRVTMSIRA